MADDLLFVYSSPGPVDLGEFTDWYDNEHVPNRLATPGFGAVARFRATDRATPEQAGPLRDRAGHAGDARLPGTVGDRLGAGEADFSAKAGPEIVLSIEQLPMHRLDSNQFTVRATRGVHGTETAAAEARPYPVRANEVRISARADAQ